MNNEEFLEIIKKSFERCLETSPKSNKKLKILHGAIAKDIIEKLGEGYKIHSLGINDDKEASMQGRYMNKKVDIGIEKDKEIIAAVALKFIMSNYSQSSNNYFENMLGETANIRSNGKPYFQIIIIPSKVPYFTNEGEIGKYETLTEHNLSKYIKLSNDNTEKYMHTPTKTLVYLVDIPINNTIINRSEYCDYYLNDNPYRLEPYSAPYNFGGTVIYNDYETFIEKICHYILSI